MMCSNYAINISVTIGPVMPAFTKTLQFISVAVLQSIFKRYTGKAALDARSGYLEPEPGLRTFRLCKPGRLDSGRLDAWTQDEWALGLWTFGIWTTGS